MKIISQLQETEEKEPESSTEPSSDDEKEELKGQCHKICVKSYFFNDRLLSGKCKAGYRIFGAC